MLLELARPVTLIASILSLLAVFHAAFLNPGSRIEDRIYDALLLLFIAAAVSAIGGIVFRQNSYLQRPRPLLLDTLPMQLFAWAAAIMLVLFLLSWYLELNFIQFRDYRL
jgi:cation transport ATPase